MFILLLSFPITANAGIICNDGWESSCVVSGPGCCSHHGGVAGNTTSSSNYDNYSYSEKITSNSSENSDYSGIAIMIIIIILIFIGAFSDNKS